MRSLRVLGGCGGWPEAGRAASGFLVEWDGFRIVLDLGYATFPRLITHCPADQVDAVVLTHGHADHCVDAHALYRARAYGESSGRIMLGDELVLGWPEIRDAATAAARARGRPYLALGRLVRVDIRLHGGR